MMKNSFYALLLCLFVFGFNGVSGQGTVLLDFGWTGYGGGTYGSDTSFYMCEGMPVTATLTTSLEHSRNWNGSGPMSLGHPGTSVLIPSPTLNLPLTMVSTLSFSAPVGNLRLLMRDLDDDVPAAGPEETFNDFRINGIIRMPDAIQATQGNYSVSGNVVTPLAADCNGWFVWNGMGIQSLSWTYTRDTDRYAFLLDSLEFVCDLTSHVVGEELEGKGIEMFPNPAADHVNLLALERGKFDSDKLDLEVLNAEGKVVVRENPRISDLARGYSLDVSGLPAGFYLVRLNRGDQVFARRLVIQ